MYSTQSFDVNSLPKRLSVKKIHWNCKRHYDSFDTIHKNVSYVLEVLPCNLKIKFVPKVTQVQNKKYTTDEGHLVSAANYCHPYTKRILHKFAPCQLNGISCKAICIQISYIVSQSVEFLYHIVSDENFWTWTYVWTSKNKVILFSSTVEW